MLLAGKKGLVLNVVNDKSIGWAIADAAEKHGAQVGIGAQNERFKEKIDTLTQGRKGFTPFLVDFADDAQFDALADRVGQEFGPLDFVVHSVGYAPKEALMNPFLETKREDFMVAMDISAYSLVRLIHALNPHIKDDASIIALSYLGATRAAHNYKVMGVCKAALESCVRYLALELGARGVRVNTISPGPVNTVAARGVRGLTDMINHVVEMAPLKREYGQKEVAGAAMYLLSDLSQGVSGQIIFVDSGYNIIAI
jgi:enoyl-[acyl-carrier protein] reductase I